jgi:hypothetical protein
MEVTSLIGDPDHKRTTIIKGGIILGEAYFELMDNFSKQYPKNKTYVLYCG